MTTTEPQTVAGATASRQLPSWLLAVLPLLLLGALIAFLALGNPLALLTSAAPPVEELSIQRIVVTPDGFDVHVMNGGPDPVTIAQVMVDDAFWAFTMDGDPTIPRLGSTTLHLNYPWVLGEPHAIVLLSSTGVTFEGEVPVALETPQAGPQQFLAYGLLGIYVGVFPVALGLLWLPTLRRMGKRWINAILALTLGLLIFLLVDTFGEVLELGATVPSVYQGVPLGIFAALLTWLVLLAVGSRRDSSERDPVKRRFYLATLIAFSIGLHNLGEGLAIGTAFALGEVSLGSFLVIGFTLHNITEGIGIAAPMTRDRPGFWRLAALTLLAGGPAVLGAWLGGFAYSPTLATIFLGIGVGAIMQVIIEVGRLLLQDAKKDDLPAVSWLNVGGLALGIGIMYLTAFLVG